MDFGLDEDARELQALAAGLLERVTAGPPDHDDIGSTDTAPASSSGDPALWKSLADAGLPGACLPEDLGGGGLAAIGMAVLLREIGIRAVPTPAYGSLVAALTIARHGGEEQRSALTAFAEGGAFPTAAVREPGPELTTSARPHGDGYVLDGVKNFVPYAEEAASVLVPARIGDEIRVFAVAAGDCRLSAQPASAEPVYRLGLDGVRVGADALLGTGAYDTFSGLATAGAVATVSGALDGALALTTAHLKGREQFGRPLAQFQAVTMQIGDVYVAKRALDVAMWAGVWRLATDQGDAAEVLAVAAWNACDPALRALYTCQHLHGGLGLDVTYPLHRHFGWVKHYAHLLGGAEAQLDTIGALVT